jgi:hypothetical protein
MEEMRLTSEGLLPNRAVLGGMCSATIRLSPVLELPSERDCLLPQIGCCPG